MIKKYGFADLLKMFEFVYTVFDTTNIFLQVISRRAPLAVRVFTFIGTTGALAWTANGFATK
jgi:hypothetical protein